MIDNSANEARAAKRLMMPVIGVLLCTAAAACLIALSGLIGTVGAGASLWLDYVLVLVAIGSTFIAGVSFIVSWVTRRRRNVVPGPALYLMGFSLFCLGAQAFVLSPGVIAAIILLLGLAVIIFEYRSDWL